MDFLDVVRKRRMVRQFSDDPIALESIERVIDVARRAPSAGFSQGVEFVVVTAEETRAELARIVANRETSATAMSRIPVQIVLCASAEIYKSRYREPDKERVRSRVSDDDLWHVPFWHVDAGASMMLLLLAAVNEGLAGSFIGVWRPDDVRELLGIPNAYTITGIVFLGHRAGTEKRQGSVTRRARRPLQDVLHRERW